MSFKENVPKYNLCADGELVHVGFISPEKVKTFINALRRNNSIYLHEGKPRDLTVIDQSKGPIVPCDWIHFQRVDWDGDSEKQVSTCRLAVGCIDKVLTPDGNMTNLLATIPTPSYRESSVIDGDPLFTMCSCPTS